MIVCSCHAVSDRALRAAAAAGATPEQIASLTRAGTSCGACREEVSEILAQAGGPCRSHACPDCPRRVAA